MSTLDDTLSWSMFELMMVIFIDFLADHILIWVFLRLKRVK